jgi:ABC-2 type transport system permease protein
MFVLMPIACVYYPVSTLPGWLQPVAWALPPTHVFEGLRAVLVDHTFRADLLASAVGLNLLWLAVGIFAFSRLLDSARRAGSLVQQGE